ncbi:hypothetical protein [Glutamicibacter soli]
MEVDGELNVAAMSFIELDGVYDDVDDRARMREPVVRNVPRDVGHELLGGPDSIQTTAASSSSSLDIAAIWSAVRWSRASMIRTLASICCPERWLL